MSTYPFPLPAQNSAAYRQVNFVPTKILPAYQLNALEEQLDSKRDMGFMHMVPEGAVINVSLSFNNGNVVFSPTNPALPMAICVQGRFEPLPSTTIAFDPAKTSGVDVIYLNWVLYRVTANTSGTINDPTLLDATTGETTAEWGQLWFELSSTDYSTQTTGVGADGVVAFDMNATPITVFQFNRGTGGSFTPVKSNRVAPEFIADTFNPGFVKLSYGSSGTACASDDPRLIPPTVGPIQIATKDVVTPVAFDPVQTNSFGAQKYDVSQNTSGILSTWILDFGHGCNLTDTLNYLVASVQALFAAVNTLGSAKPTTASTSSPQIPSQHVGQSLGQPNTHPASVNSGTDGFTVGQPSGTTPSSGNYAYAIKDPTGTVLAGITHDGDFYSKKLSTLLKNGSGNPVSLLSALGAIVQILENAEASESGSGVAQSYVDTAVAAALQAANAYTNSHSAAAAVAQTIQSAGPMTYSIVTIGNLKLAFGTGVLVDGQTVPVPSGFTSSNGMATAGYGQDSEVESNIVSTQCYVSDLVVFSRKTRSDGSVASVKANVFAVFWNIGA